MAAPVKSLDRAMASPEHPIFSGGQSGMAAAPFSSVTNISETTELGESLRELNSDAIESTSRMSGIDLRARLRDSEISALLAVDGLVALGALPRSILAFTRQKKRLSVSLSGKGREEIVQLVAGKKEQERAVGGMGLVERFKSAFGGGSK